jgi:hypothetical protein
MRILQSWEWFGSGDPPRPGGVLAMVGSTFGNLILVEKGERAT